jgi:alkylation response protein AidB-like acyl-CoA dehydrogenase
MPDTIFTNAALTDWIGMADRIGQDIAEAASRHDREESFVREGFEALREAGFFKALVPAEFGGGGADYRVMCDRSAGWRIIAARRRLPSPCIATSWRCRPGGGGMSRHRSRAC